MEGAPEAQVFAGVTETQTIEEAELDATLAQLEGLSEDELYALVGAGSLSPIDYTSAAAYQYAPELAPEFESRQLIARVKVDLPFVGRRRVERILDKWGEELRERICPLWAKGVSERELALNIGLVLVGLLHGPAGVIAAIGLIIAMYLITKLCEGYKREPEPAT